MPTEYITIDGRVTETLPEYLRPGLRAVFVGLNPSPVSVAAGHYYQGKLGRRFWSRVRDYGLIPWERIGVEDEFAFKLGFGFTDVVRRPTARADGLTREEMRLGATKLQGRLSAVGDHPVIIFVFATAFEAASPSLQRVGFKTLRFPGPYAASETVKNEMLQLCIAVGLR